MTTLEKSFKEISESYGKFYKTRIPDKELSFYKTDVDEKTGIVSLISLESKTIKYLFLGQRKKYYIPDDDITIRQVEKFCKRLPQKEFGKDIKVYNINQINKRLTRCFFTSHHSGNRRTFQIYADATKKIAEKPRKPRKPRAKKTKKLKLKLEIQLNSGISVESSHHNLQVAKIPKLEIEVDSGISVESSSAEPKQLAIEYPTVFKKSDLWKIGKSFGIPMLCMNEDEEFRNIQELTNYIEIFGEMMWKKKKGNVSKKDYEYNFGS
jgi:hypothetical protein